jgi:hypothetical protein
MIQLKLVPAYDFDTKMLVAVYIKLDKPNRPGASITVGYPCPGLDLAFDLVPGWHWSQYDSELAYRCSPHEDEIISSLFSATFDAGHYQHDLDNWVKSTFQLSGVKAKRLLTTLTQLIQSHEITIDDLKYTQSP